MTTLADKYIAIHPDMSGFGRELSRDVSRQVGPAGRSAARDFAHSMDRDAGRHGKRIGVGLSKSVGGGFRAGIGGALRGGFAAAAVGVAGAAGLVAGLKSFVAEGRESNKVAALTAQVIKTTGGAANLTAGQVERLSTAISNKTGIDDEAIQRGANLLLTFKNLRNEAGKGNDVFTQTTALTQDMSVALGTDAKSAALQLGKALNDPTTGLTALRRSGVAFTKQQQEQIKVLFESGHRLQAQKMILHEVGQEFGGAAAAAATNGDKLRVNLDNLKESVGKALIPVLDRLFGWISNKGIPALRDFGGWVQEHILPTMRRFGGYLTDKLWPALNRLWQQVWPDVQDALSSLKQSFGDLIGSFTHGTGKASDYGDTLVKVLPIIGRFISAGLKLMALNVRILTTTLRALTLPIRTFARVAAAVFPAVASKFLDLVGAIVHGAAKAFGWMGPLGGKLRDAASHFDTFRDHVNRALDGTEKTHDITIKTRIAALTGPGVNQGEGGTKGLTLRARGGAVFGPGSATSDSIPAMLSNGEHVWTADEVRKAGGHGAMEAMRQQVRRLARGGPVIHADFPTMRAIVDPVSGFIGSVERRVAAAAQKIADSLGRFSPNLTGALNFAHRQVGKPYIWGGVGPGGYDCSGFMSALVNVAKGADPYHRLFATGSFGGGSGPAGFVRNLASAFRVGVFQGNPGHMAGTINGTNVESRGGEGVVVGGRARGWNDPLFSMHYGLRGFARGGRVGDPAFDILDPRGKHHMDLLRMISPRTAVKQFDRGGLLMPGTTLAVNNTGKPERVVGPQDDQRLERAFVRAISGLRVEMDGKQMGRVVGKRADLLRRGG